MTTKSHWADVYESFEEDLKHCQWKDLTALKWQRMKKFLRKTIKRSGGINYSAFPINFRWHLCSTRLSLGKFDNWDGWEYRSDWSITFQGWNGGPKGGMTVPKWNGNKVKHLIIASEQGIGDEILYASAIPELIVRLGHDPLELQCHPRLFPVFRRSFGIKCTPRRVLSQIEGEASVVALADLFMFYRRNKSHFPRKPFLKPDQNIRKAWLERLWQYPKPWIGVAWKARHGILDVNKLIDKISPRGTLFNVQYEGKHEKLVEIQPNSMLDMENHLNFISCLDRVVSVTQTVVHECGGLGVLCDAIKPPKGTGKVDPALWYYGIGNDVSHMIYGSVKVFNSLEEYEYRQ